MLEVALRLSQELLVVVNAFSSDERLILFGIFANAHHSALCGIAGRTVVFLLKVEEDPLKEVKNVLEAFFYCLGVDRVSVCAPKLHKLVVKLYKEHLAPLIRDIHKLDGRGRWTIF